MRERFLTNRSLTSRTWSISIGSTRIAKRWARRLMGVLVTCTFPTWEPLESASLSSGTIRSFVKRRWSSTCVQMAVATCRACWSSDCDEKCWPWTIHAPTMMRTRILTVCSLVQWSRCSTKTLHQTAISSRRCFVKPGLDHWSASARGVVL